MRNSAVLGMDYVADGAAFCPHPNMTKWVEVTAAQCFGAAVR